MQRGVVDDEEIAVRLEVDFVDLDLLLDDGPRVAEPSGVFHFLDLVGAHVNGGAEVLIVTGKRGGGGG
ncbi:MAG: hypothetical protein NVV63_06030 [Opitutus sp.]|nr:hypothetical protein [Opitutus sp.]